MIINTSQSSVVKDGLVLWLDAGHSTSYPKAGTTWYDISGNGNDGTLTNGPTYDSSNKGNISLDGGNDYILVNDSSSLDFGSGSFTVEFWFRKQEATTSGFQNIYGPGKWNTGASPGTNEWALLIGNGSTGNSDECQFAVERSSDNTRYRVTSTFEISLNTWYQLVGIRDGASLKLYINGQVDVDDASTGLSAIDSINNVGNDLLIGNSVNLPGTLYSECDVSSLRIYNRALSSTEISQNFNAQKGRYGIVS